MTAPAPSIIYKICAADAWTLAESAGSFAGSVHDVRDGYIHFSAAAQARETAARHFAGKDNLIIAAIDAQKLGKALRWEPSRGGALFPHLYASLAMSAVLWVKSLPTDARGQHIFPAEMT
jgi:uncharacterized protein (DUF952 family)